MAKQAIEYLEDKGIENVVVLQTNKKRIYLSDLLDTYAESKVIEAFNLHRRGVKIIVEY